MNEILQERLQQIANNDILIMALKELFDEQLKKEVPQINKMANNFLIGEQYRAYTNTKEIIDRAFLALTGFKTTSKIINQFNKER